jgi:hypothetical protein
MGKIRRALRSIWEWLGHAESADWILSVTGLRQRFLNLLGVAVFSVIGLAVGVWTRVPGYWIVAFFLAVAVIGMALVNEAQLLFYRRHLRRAASGTPRKPELAIDPPIEEVTPKRYAGRAKHRKFKVRIWNRNPVLAINCSAKLASFINNEGSESHYIGQNFRLTNDIADAGGAYRDSVKFNIPSESHAIIDVAEINETLPYPFTFMLFASQTVQMPQPRFPHVLKIEFGGENTQTTVKTYLLRFSDDGILRMEEKP